MHGPPWPLEVIFTLVFSVGLVVVSVITQVALPILLRVLSMFFARRALLEAADSVQQAGGQAVRSIAQSRRWMRGEPPARPAAGEPPARSARIAADVGRRDEGSPAIRVTHVEPGEPLEELEEQDEPSARHKL
jgi:hypothetical protein